MSALTNAKIPKIQGPGLKKEGVVVLQSLVIAFFSLIEYKLRGGVGSVTGIVICLAVFAGNKYGRKGVRYVAVVTPPIAFAASMLLANLLTSGLHISRLGIDFISSLASVAPFLIISALYGWFMYFNEKAKSRPSRKNIPSV